MAIIDVLSKYDPLLREITSGPNNSEKSAKIQNELIQLLSKKVENIIFKPIESAQVFSVLKEVLGTTTYF